MNGRILIVHAAVVMRMIVRDGLAAHGYEVVGQAENGRQAVEIYRVLRPDAVTMDMVLPELDGIAAVRTLVAEFPGARIVICTSLSQPELIVEALGAGAKAFITKPFGPAKLADVVAKLLAPARAA